MHIKDERMTVQLNRDTAIVTVAFAVILMQIDLDLVGGFWETVFLSKPLPPLTSAGVLPMAAAVQSNPHATYKELYREHKFHAPCYPAGPFSTVRFYGHINIRPAIERRHEQVTNEGVLPAAYSLRSLLTDTIRRIRTIMDGWPKSSR